MILQKSPLLAAVVIAILPAIDSMAALRSPFQYQQELEPRPTSTPSVLDGIAADMRSGMRPERDASLDVRTGNQLRQLVIELALQGRREEPGSRTAALAAIRLGHEVRKIEAWITRVVREGVLVGDPPSPLNEDARLRILRRLEVFNHIALDEFRRRPRQTPREVDDALAVVLAPIRDAIEVVHGRTLQSRWPIIPDGSLPADPRTPKLTPATLRLDAIKRFALDSTMPVRFREVLAPHIEKAAEAITLGPADQNFESRLAGLERMTRLAGDFTRAEYSADPTRSYVEAISRAIAERQGPPDRTNLTTALKELLLPTDLLPRSTASMTLSELRTHRRRLRNQYDQNLRSIKAENNAPDARWIDQVAELQISARDVQRTHAAERLLVELTAVSPTTRPRIITRLRTLLRLLASSRTREEAAVILDRLEFDAARFLVLPGQDLLDSPSEAFNRRIAGRATDLATRIQIARRGWVEEISQGLFEGPYELELERLSRLLAVLVQVNDFSPAPGRLTESIEICNRWGGWFIDADSIAWSARTLAPGLLVAADGAADGDIERLERDLDRLEHLLPPARLLIWLADVVQDSLTGLPTGGIGAIATLATPPGPGAWGIDHRNSFASIARGFAEISEARRREDDAGVEMLSAWIADACDDLLFELDASNSISSGTDARPESGFKEQGP